MTKQRSDPNCREEHNRQDDEASVRGVILPRILLGAFVILIIARPLVTAVIDIQAALAGTQLFSWASAGVIALLIGAVIIATALGLE